MKSFIKYIVDNDHIEVIKECEITCPNCDSDFTTRLYDNEANDCDICPDCGQGVRIVIEEE